MTADLTNTTQREERKIADMNPIVRVSEHVEKPRDKDLALKALRNVIAELTNSQADAMRVDLARLYATHLPPQPKKPKTPFQWVSLAVPKKDERFYLCYVYVTADRLIATDGHRLHTAPNTDGLEPGYYNTAGDRVQGPDYARYPDIDRVIPDPDADGRARVLFSAASLPLGDDQDGGRTFQHREFRDAQGRPARVNAKYLNDAVSMDGLDAELTWSIGDREEPIRTCDLSGGRVAVILPLKMGEE